MHLKQKVKKYFSPTYCALSNNSNMLTYSPQKIIALRLDRGLNQSELARKAGLSSPTIWALEKGETKMPKYDTLRDIAIALGVTLPDIMADEQPSDLDAQIIAATAALSPSHKASILILAKALLESEK